MKVCKANLFPLISFLFLVVLGTHANARRLGSSSPWRGASQGNDQDYGFPRIYTALFPSQGEDATTFVSSLDVLNVDVEDKTNNSVTFMVHSEQDLQHMQKILLNHPEIESVAFDAKQTTLYATKATRHGNSKVQNDNASTYSSIDGFSCYRNLAGMEQFMTDLVKRAESIPNLNVTLTDIGDSYLKSQNSQEGYDIWALNITGHGVQAKGLTTEKGMFFALTGLHAREYSPPELGARFIEMLVDGYGNDADITALLDHTEIHWVLEANPDGRFVAETRPNLYRRKNLNGSSLACGEGGYGVDLNRNFPFKWGEPGASGFPCAETYRGAAPASEPEVQAIVNYVSNIFPADMRKADPEGQMNEAYPEDIKGIFFDLHSYGEIIIWPWGHINQETANDDDLETLVRKFRHFNGYDFAGPNMNFLYPASGATDDWAYGALGVPGMTFELGTDFLQECDYFESDIVPKNLPALYYAAKTSRAPYLISKGPDVTSLELSNTSFALSDSNAILTVTAHVSDAALSSDNFPTSQQLLCKVQVHFDSHPYDLDGTLGEQTPTVLEIDGFNAGTEIVTLSVSMTRLESLLSQPLAGNHTIHVQGTDCDGYTGPVSAASFEIVGDSAGTTPEECQDSPTETFLVDIETVGERDCEWLSMNFLRFEYLCDLVDVARRCPKTCSQCEVFG